MANIIYEEGGRFYVTRERTGKSESYLVYEHGATAAHKVAVIGCSLGWQRVLAEISKRKTINYPGAVQTFPRLS